MKFIFIADLHVHPFREYSSNNGMDRLQDGLSVLEQACQLATEEKCPLIIGGDLKFHKDRWYDAVLNGYLDVFAKYTDIEIIIYGGNHDGVKGQASGLEVFRHTSNVVTLTRPRFEVFRGMKTLFYPWSPDWHDLPMLINEARKAKCDLLFSHAFLEGAKIGSGDYQLKRGLPLAAFGLDPEDRVFTWAFFGDIHKQQCVKAFYANHRGKTTTVGGVWYAGSPYAQRKDETESNKGALLVDLEASPAVTPVPLHAPKFLRLDFTELKDTKALELNVLAQQQGNFVDVTVPHNTDQTVLEQIRKALQPRAFYVHTQAQRKTGVSRRAELHAGMSAKELVQKYLKTKPLPEGVPLAVLEQAGLMLLEHVNN